MSTWVSDKSPFYKDKELKPVSKNELVESIKNSLLKVAYYDRQVAENQFRLIYASYNSINDPEINEDSIDNTGHLSYTRAANRQALNMQVDLVKQLYEMSAIGNDARKGYVIFDIPRRQIFNPIHYVFAPLLYLFAEEEVKNSLTLKKNGAYRTEQVESFDYIKAYLASHIR